MEAQEIFDTVATHLFKQGSPAEDPGGACLYRMEDGRRCAVGVLISDKDLDLLTEEIDMHQLGGVDTLFEDGDFVNTESYTQLEYHLELLCKLQNVHDNSMNWQSEGNMKAALSYVARQEQLDASVLSHLTMDKERVQL